MDVALVVVFSPAGVVAHAMSGRFSQVQIMSGSILHPSPIRRYSYCSELTTDLKYPYERPTTSTVRIK